MQVIHYSLSLSFIPSDYFYPSNQLFGHFYKFIQITNLALLQGWVPQTDRQGDREMHKKQCLMFSYGRDHIGSLDFWQVLVETSVTPKNK